MKRNNSSGSIWIDFLTFWGIRVPLWWSVVDWFRVLTGLAITVSVGALVFSLLAICITSGFVSFEPLSALFGLHH